MKNFLLLLFLVQQGFAAQQPLQTLPASADGTSSAAISDPNAALHQQILQNTFKDGVPVLGNGPHHIYQTDFVHDKQRYQVQVHYHLIPIKSPTAFTPGVGQQPTLPYSSSSPQVAEKRQQLQKLEQEVAMLEAQERALGNQCLSKKDIQEAQTAWSGFMEAAVGSLCDGGCPK